VPGRQTAKPGWSCRARFLPVAVLRRGRPNRGRGTKRYLSFLKNSDLAPASTRQGHAHGRRNSCRVWVIVGRATMDTPGLLPLA
jgi:hypothetical protein